MELIQIETSFGTVAASEQALVDAVRELLVLHVDDTDLPDEGPGGPVPVVDLRDV